MAARRSHRILRILAWTLLSLAWAIYLPSLLLYSIHPGHWWVMGILSIPLDVVTITFASIAIGIGVDNAIHLTIWYRRMSAEWPNDVERRIEETLRIAGRPMALTSLSITAALLVFVFSAFRPVVYFGMLISMSLVLTTLAALMLLPALLYIGGRRELARLARRAGASR